MTSKKQKSEQAMTQCTLHIEALSAQSHGKLKLEREQRELDPWDATVPEAHQSFFFFFLLVLCFAGKKRGEPC